MKISALFYSTLLVAHVAAHETHKHPHPPTGKVVTSVQKTGSGAFLYETVPGWGKMPDGQNVGPTHGGVAVDSKGCVYVSTDANHGVVKFSRDGEFIKSFGPTTKGLHSLYLSKNSEEEVLWGAAVGDRKMYKMSLEGKILFTLPNDNTAEVPGTLKGVTAVTVDPEGNIYAACGYGSNQIHKFDSTGKLLKSVGSRGSEDGQFVTCHGITFDPRFDEPRLLVADRENRRLVHLDLDLNFMSVHATHLRRPCAISLYHDYSVVAELEGRATIFGKEGQPLAFLGDQPNRELWAHFPAKPEQLFDGLFTAPHGVSWDNEGNVIVQDWNSTGRLTKLKRVK